MHGQMDYSGVTFVFREWKDSLNHRPSPIGAKISSRLILRNFIVGIGICDTKYIHVASFRDVLIMRFECSVEQWRIQNDPAIVDYNVLISGILRYRY